VELLIEKAIEMENLEERQNAIIYIGKLMKNFYGTWNKENVDDAVIVEHLREMSGNKLLIGVDKVKAENLFDQGPKERNDRDRDRDRDKNKFSGSNNPKKQNNSSNTNNRNRSTDNFKKRNK
jgi:hypothetical protein